MPIHDYRCKSCEHEFEVLYSTFSAVGREEPEEVCPKCDSKEKSRLLNKATSFVLKGGGWARDLYAGKKKD